MEKGLFYAYWLEGVMMLRLSGSCSASWCDVVLLSCAVGGVFLLYGSPKYRILKWRMEEVYTESLKFNTFVGFGSANMWPDHTC